MSIQEFIFLLLGIFSLFFLIVWLGKTGQKNIGFFLAPLYNSKWFLRIQEKKYHDYRNKFFSKRL